MFAIKTVFLPHVHKLFDAEFVANIFEKNGIAKVNKVYFEPNNECYNRVYIGIDTWQETETAYSFINRLRSSNKETRIVYQDDDWWTVQINKYPHKLDKNNRVLTVFKQIKENDSDMTIDTEYFDDEISTEAVGFAEEIDEEIEENKEPTIDYEKTELLKRIIANLKSNHVKEYKENKEVKIDYKKTELLKCIIANLKTKQEDTNEFESYLREAYNDRELWYSEQYIYDALGM